MKNCITKQGIELLKQKLFIWVFSQKLLGLKKWKTKGSDGQPSMYIYISPRGRAEKAAEIQDNSFVSRFFLSWHEQASCQDLTKKPDWSDARLFLKWKAIYVERK